MNTGITKNLIETELPKLMVKIKNVHALYGFGSFFRSSEYKDIDLVVVINCNRDEQLETYEKILEAIQPLSKSIGTHFDITPLTVTEFGEAPLREMKFLVPLYAKPH